MRYAFYANRKLVKVFTDRDAAWDAYERAKWDPNCNHVALARVRRGKQPQQEV